MIAIVLILIFFAWINAIEYRKLYRAIYEINDMGERVYKMKKMKAHKIISILCGSASLFIMVVETLTFKH